MSQMTLEFDAVYREYRPKIVGYLTRLVGSGEAEDLAQEVFVKAGRMMGDFCDGTGFRAWIYRVATNAAIDRMRSPEFRLRGATREQVEAVDGCSCCAAAEKEVSIERQAIRKEMTDCVQDVMSGLREPYRSVLVLSKMAELKNNEIAEMLGLSLDTVKIRLHRARAQMKKELEKCCSFYRDERNELACDSKRIGE
ncbi:MAG: RNA polymerase sigma factor [Acidobacteria bacterium]|nr:RNA polymerase sigma factor [Acidobacteriota bacterium]